VDLCESIGETAVSTEVHLLLDGLVSPNVLIRITCLEGLMVRLPTATEPTSVHAAKVVNTGAMVGPLAQYIAWTPELAELYTVRAWVACHDDEERATALAQQLWQETGSSISEAYTTQLRDLLGKRHA